jgi:hypothetical protein
MFNLLSKFIFLILILNFIQCQNPNPAETYLNKYEFESPESYVLYWNHTETDVKFEIHYKNTSKWIIFGVHSETYSDIVVGWVNDDGTGHFSDRKLTNQNVMTIDENQDWIIDDAFSENNYKILKFNRKIKQDCGTDSLEDLDFQPGTIDIVYAFGNKVDNNEGEILDFSSVKIIPLELLKPGTYNCQPKKPQGEFTSQPLSAYSNYIDLIDEGIFRFYWNNTATDLIGEIHVKTNGWVGFGLSPNGGMANSDVIVGWIDDNTGAVNFTVSL